MKVQNPTGRKSNRSGSNFDSQRRFDVIGNSEVPFAKGRRFLNQRGIISILAGGWSRKGVASLYSDFPFTPSLGDANGIPGANTLGLAIRARLGPFVPIRNPRWTRQKTYDIPYFKPPGLCPPRLWPTRQYPRTEDWARGPWRPNLNLSVFRSF